MASLAPVVLPSCHVERNAHLERSPRTTRAAVRTCSGYASSCVGVPARGDGGPGTAPGPQMVAAGLHHRAHTPMLHASMWGG